MDEQTIDFSAVDELADIAKGTAHNYAMDYECREWHREETLEKEALKWLGTALDLADYANCVAKELIEYLKLTDEELAYFAKEGIVRRFCTEQELLQHDHHDEWWADFMAALKAGTDVYKEFRETPWKPRCMRGNGE